MTGDAPAEPCPSFAPPRWIVYLLFLGCYLTLRGYHSFDSDQAYRLPLLIHQQDPRIFSNDPFVQAFSAFNPHRGSLIVLDFVTRPFGLSAGLFFLFVLTFAATCVGVDRLTRAVWPDGGSNVGLVAVGLVLAAKAGNIGTNHLFEAMVLDRVMAFALGWLALACAVTNPARVGVPAAAIALATFIHPSVGLQLAIILAGSWTFWFLLGRRTQVGLRTAMTGFAGIAIAVVPGLAVNLAANSPLLGDMPAQDFWLLTAELQSPQHMLPHLWWMPQWLAWGCYLALATLALTDARSRLPAVASDITPDRTRLTVVLGVILVWLGASWYGIEILHQLRVTIFQPFRMATIARGIALVLISGRLIALWRTGESLGRMRAILIGMAFGGDWLLVVVTLTELTTQIGHNRIFPALLRGGLGGWSRRYLLYCPRWVQSGQARVETLDTACPPAFVRGAPTGGDHPPELPLRKGGKEDPIRCRHDHNVRSPLQSSAGENWIARLASWLGFSGAAWFGMLAFGFIFLARHDTQFGNRTLLAALIVGSAAAHFGRSTRSAWSSGSLLGPWKPRRLRVAFLITWAVPLAALMAAAVPSDHRLSRHSLVRSLVSRCRFALVPTDDVERLALWCRDHTPSSARFIGPPGPKTFRLWSLRSLAFNRAASPYDAAGLADWFSRFADHVNFHGSPAEFVRAYVADRHGFESRFQGMTDVERAALAIRQEATYIVAEYPKAQDLQSTHSGPLELLHAEGHYAVYQVKSERLVQRQR
jgi:hypothetical protein